MPRQVYELSREIEVALQELEWWRHFATKIMPGSDMPKIGSSFLGERYSVIRDKKYDDA